MEKFEVHPTSRNSAVCSDIVLREGEMSRLAFRPEIVNNPKDEVAAVKGRFVYQKKGKKDTWEKASTGSVRSLKTGDAYELELHSGELIALWRGLKPLYRLYRTEGIPKQRAAFVRLREPLAKLLELSGPDLDAFLSDNKPAALETARRLLAWLAANPNAPEHFGGDQDKLPELNALVGLANLRAVLDIWDKNKTNSNEEFWQRVFKRHAFILSQVFAYPVAVIDDKAYVGGKEIDNLHGNVLDFLGRVPSSGSAVLIEIKTPETPLLASKYRAVYPSSSELSGAVVQVLSYRESLLSELDHLMKGRSGVLSTAEPRCVVIAGNAAKQLTDPNRRACFERVRERLFGVTVVTYDELFGRVAGLISLLERVER
jgi:hypothetical protein